jgi:hypothetical protein
MAGAFLYDNLVAGAASVAVNGTLGGLSEATPASNLLDPQPRLRVRAFLFPAWVQVLVDFGASRSMDCVAFISSNATASATARVRLSTADPTGLAGDAWDTGSLPGDTAADANGNIVVVRAAGLATGRYLLADIIDGTIDFMDLGLLVAGPLWRLSRAQSYGLREGRIILDQRDRNPFTGAEFPVPALFNPRFAAFAVQNMRGSEIVGDQRAMVRKLGAVRDALWIPDTGLSRFEMNRRAIWGAAAQPGDDVGAERVNFPGWSQAWRLIERG